MSLYNKDELTPPKWLTEEFIKQVLKEYEKDEHIELTECDITPASLKGDHYASVMFRIKTVYIVSKANITKSKSLILKTIPDEEGEKRKMLTEFKAFETEIEMYAKVLPAFEKILSEHGDNTKFGPRIIYHALKPNQVIILEDLCELGYKVIRDRYTNEQEMRAIYKKIAKFHAISYMIGKSEDHDLVSKFQAGIFSYSIALTHPVMTKGLPMFINMLSEHEELKPYEAKFKAMENNLLLECQKLYRAYGAQNDSGSGSDIFVLNHGDFHMKNMMFKYNNKTNLEDVAMLDFQFCVFAPSNIDMVYSTYMMLSPELRLRSDELLRYYFEQFIETLKLIKYQGELPKFVNFRIGNLKYRHFALFMIATFLPMIYSVFTLKPDDLKDTEVGEMLEQNADLSQFYRHPEYLAEIKKLLPVMLNAGYLD